MRHSLNNGAHANAGPPSRPDVVWQARIEAVRIGRIHVQGRQQIESPQKIGLSRRTEQSDRIFHHSGLRLSLFERWLHESLREDFD